MDNDREATLAQLTAALTALEIDFRLPWGLALDEEESRRARDAEVGAAIRLAILLLQAPAAEDGGRITVAADSRGVSYAIFAPDGSLEDADDDWEPLVRRLETGLADTASVATVFWP